MKKIKSDQLVNKLKIGDLLVFKNNDSPTIITDIWEGKDDERYEPNGFWLYQSIDKQFFFDNSTSHSKRDYATWFDEVYRRGSTNQPYELFALKKNNCWYLIKGVCEDERMI